MSGIAGIVECRGPTGVASDAAIRRMLSVMAYRGPDGVTTDVHPGYAFGYLALVSSSFHCAQPLCIAGDTIVADVRLDDRAKLAGQLGVPEQTPDAALVLKAYQRWGKRCVDYLIGDFAFVISSPAGIFCARDHMGVKPFYYSESGGNFIFASEARAVRLATGAEINEERIADFLVYPLEHMDTRSTFYRGVFRLPPASILAITPSGTSIVRYWHPAEKKGAVFNDDEACIEAFSEQLEIAVSDRLADTGATAMGLSGGVDSTTLVGVAQSLGAPVDTYSTVCEPTVSCLESDYIRLAESEMNLDATLLGPVDMSATIDEVFHQLEQMQEPFDYGMVQIMMLNIVASRDGYKSVIDGVEGDMLYSMPSNYPAMLYRQGRIVKGVCEALATVKRTGEMSYPLALWTSLRQLGAPRLLAGLKQIVVGDAYAREVSESLISETFAARTGTASRLGRHQKQLYSATVGIRDSYYRQVLHPALTAAMERYDRVAALSGIEPRHPLMDKRLVDLALRMPSHLRVNRGWSKYALRKAGQGKIPEPICWRTDKSENAWCCDEVMTKHKGADIKAFVHGSSNRLSQYVRPDALASDGEELVSLFGLAKWLQVEDGLVAG